MKILLVEDDFDLAEAMLQGLEQKNLDVTWIRDGKSALHEIYSNNYAIVILDLCIPKIPGMELLKNIRLNKINIPVIVLTARDTIDDCVMALNHGADDYMTKPFDLSELIARIKAHTRRTLNNDEVISFNNIKLKLADYSVYIDDVLVPMTRREFSLLKKFLENPGRVLSRETLAEAIYNIDDEIESNAIDVHMHNLRKKMNKNLIRTIRGIGYILEKNKS